MRWMRFTLPLLLLTSPLAFGQKQYTEGACLLLQHQIVQFSNQPNSHNYQSAKREFDNHCQNPIPAPVKDLVLTNIPAKPITVGSVKNTVTTKPVNANVAVKAATPPPVKPAPSAQPKPADVLKGLFAPVLALLGSMLAMLLLLALVVGLLAYVAGRYAARIKGALGEWALHKVLAKELPSSYQHYRNLVIPTATGDFTEVDHLVLSPFGIFVIEVKNYRGWIFGGEKQPKWTVQRFRSKHQFMNPLHQNYKHTEAVKQLLGLTGKDGDSVHSIVAFSLRAQFKFQIPANVKYTDLVGDYINRFTQPCFSDDQLRQFSARLNMAKAGKKVLRKLHKQQFNY
ncbi:Nuclease-related domain-containing protein [Rheinheimera pacifica]|uniref:Nuclease-related domain-containing protein n=1 Tax=Rheinheimera pacifica TaxID=173990 RepID=A0A1H6LHQ8_9GAMM|nr:nuclease-related domain-containing protein [Rheinheimera pacifica]SEH85757.1 Nuclease-related domain-containing protein [Rheinheimera pacifica]